MAPRIASRTKRRLSHTVRLARVAYTRECRESPGRVCLAWLGQALKNRSETGSTTTIRYPPSLHGWQRVGTSRLFCLFRLPQRLRSWILGEVLIGKSVVRRARRQEPDVQSERPQRCNGEEMWLQIQTSPPVSNPQHAPACELRPQDRSQRNSRSRLSGRMRFLRTRRGG